MYILYMYMIVYTRTLSFLTVACQSLINRLEEAGVRYRFVTNTTKESSLSLMTRLRNLGIAVSPNDIFSSLSATRRYLDLHSLRPSMFLEEDALKDFQGL